MRQTENILETILTNCKKVTAFIHDISKESFIADDEKQYAVCMALLQIGEMVALLPDAYKAQHPHTPWRQIRGMRNTIVHAYARLEIELLWQTISEDIPALLQDIQWQLHEIDKS